MDECRVDIGVEYRTFTGENINEVKEFVGAQSINMIEKKGKVVLYLYFPGQPQGTIKVPINDCVVKIGGNFVTVSREDMAKATAGK